MKAALRLLPSILIVAASAKASTVAPSDASRAALVCARATSKLGVDGGHFIEGGWAKESVDGAPGDRFYSKGDLRVSLGLRPGVGGSCIVSFTATASYDLPRLTRELERAFHVRALASGPTFALLPLVGQSIQARITPIPNGSVVSVAVETGG